MFSTKVCYPAYFIEEIDHGNGDSDAPCVALANSQYLSSASSPPGGAGFPPDLAELPLAGAVEAAAELSQPAGTRKCLFRYCIRSCGVEDMSPASQQGRACSCSFRRGLCERVAPWDGDPARFSGVTAPFEDASTTGRCPYSAQLARWEMNEVTTIGSHVADWLTEAVSRPSRQRHGCEIRSHYRPEWVAGLGTGRQTTTVYWRCYKNSTEPTSNPDLCFLPLLCGWAEMRVVVLGRTPGRTSAVGAILGLEDLDQGAECCKHTAEVAGRKVGGKKKK